MPFSPHLLNQLTNRIRRQVGRVADQTANVTPLERNIVADRAINIAENASDEAPLFLGNLADPSYDFVDAAFNEIIPQKHLKTLMMADEVPRQFRAMTGDTFLDLAADMQLPPRSVGTRQMTGPDAAHARDLSTVLNAQGQREMSQLFLPEEGTSNVRLLYEFARNLEGDRGLANMYRSGAPFQYTPGRFRRDMTNLQRSDDYIDYMDRQIRNIFANSGNGEISDDIASNMVDVILGHQGRHRAGSWIDRFGPDEPMIVGMFDNVPQKSAVANEDLTSIFRWGDITKALGIGGLGFGLATTEHDEGI